MTGLWAACFAPNSRVPKRRLADMGNFYPLRDLSGRQIPGLPSVVELPDTLSPRDYEDGVYLIGELFIPVADMDRLDPYERQALLRHPHMLLYGHRGREMQLMENHILKRVAVAVVACLLLAHPLLGLLS